MEETQGKWNIAKFLISPDFQIQREIQDIRNSKLFILVVVGLAGRLGHPKKNYYREGQPIFDGLY